jgi:hypothetical protein
MAGAYVSGGLPRALWHHRLMPVRTLAARRYVTPLREGGSLPAVVEGDDDGLYVLKFSGAGQGTRALVAELIAGRLARAAGLPIPEIVLMRLDPDLGRTEPDPEIQALIRASAGLNVALDYLPGAIAFDPIAWTPDADLASRLVWFDAFIANVDRTAKNVNLLVWHSRLWLIDHGAALYFHHDWEHAAERSGDPFTRIRDHVLLPQASRLREVDEEMAARLDPAAIRDAVESIPQEWLPAPADAAREAYRTFLERRVAAPRAFMEEAVRAHAQRV